MRSLSDRERRLLMLVAAAAFLIFNFLGYQALAQRRAGAVAQQRSLKIDIAHLKDLQAAKPAADVNAEWINSHLPAYKDIDQLETHLFNVVTNLARAAGDIQLTKKDPRPTQKNDPLVHRSIMEIECTAEIGDLVNFLHSLQDRDAFRFINFLELTPTKDEEKVRCQARVEQWWRPDSEELAGIIASDVPTIPDLPVTPSASPPEVEAPTAPTTDADADKSKPVEQPAAETVQPVLNAPPPAGEAPSVPQ